MQELPLLNGIFKGSWHVQLPTLVELVKSQIRADGHWQLLVPKTGPVLN